MTKTSKTLAFVRSRPKKIMSFGLRSARLFAAVTAVLALSFVADAAHHQEDREGMSPKQGEVSETGCFRQESGGYVCRYDLPKDYDPDKASQSRQMEVFEGCLRNLYDSCRGQGGSRNCGWTAQLSCRSLSKPPGESS